MTTFQRARSAEQREQRRTDILSTAAAMVDQMPVSEISLNELSRRVGLAKSNVLRYFESREAVLLDLLDAQWRAWLADLPELLTTGVAPGAAADRRIEDLARVLATSLADRPALCELLSAQASVLERNVSPEVAARYKRAALDDVAHLADLVRTRLPELDQATAAHLCAALVLLVSAAWSHAHPSAAMQQAYAADASLAASRLHFTDTVHHAATLLMTGALHQTST